MNFKAILYAHVLLSMFVVFPVGVESQELLVPLNDETKKIFDQLLDIELLKNNITQCYQAGKGVSTLTSLAYQPWEVSRGLDGKLLKRVCERLWGTLEYERFMDARRSIIQRSDYRHLYASELFEEYMRLLETARTRLTIQLRESAR